MLATAARSNPRSVILKSVLFWLPLAAVCTVLAGLVYVAVQQDLRGTANDPQIQMAQDAATGLQAGASPASLTGSGKVDIAHSLAPYLIIYDDAGNVLSSCAELN